MMTKFLCCVYVILVGLLAIPIALIMSVWQLAKRYENAIDVKVRETFE